MAMTANAKKQAALVKRRRRQGLVCVRSLWMHKDDVQTLKAIVAMSSRFTKTHRALDRATVKTKGHSNGKR